MHEDGKKPKFPLPRGYFGDVRLTKEQEQYYREFCANQVQRGLLDERTYLQNHRTVDTKKWKPIRSHHKFQVYRRADAGLYENDGKPSMLGLGRVEGSIEDVLYGAYDDTDDELRMTAELVDVDFSDGIVLSNMEQGSPEDQYRYLGLKWILTRMPVPGMMDRDWVLLESSGISTDASGKRYGYHTLFTVELPHCQPFPGIIRGTMWYTFIYRDIGKGMIDVHSQGYFDCLGDIIDLITIKGSNAMFNGVFRYMKSAEAKKLTILALENLEQKIASGHHATMAMTTSKHDTPPDATCSICDKTKSSKPFSSRRMRVCGTCDAFVCMGCRVQKNILVGRQRVQCKVSVCQKCIALVKTLIVEPANEKYVISREMQVGDRSTKDSTWSSTSSQATLASSSRRAPASAPQPQQHQQHQHSFGKLVPRHRGVSYASPNTKRAPSSTTSSCFSAAYDCDLNEGDATTYGSQKNPSTINENQEDAETEYQQQALFARMLELQTSANRVHELTLETHRAMMMSGQP